MPGCLLDGSKEASIAEGVTAPGHVRFVDQLETDRTQKVHILLLNETDEIKRIQIKRKNVRLTFDRVQVVPYQRPILSENTVQIKVKRKKTKTYPVFFLYFNKLILKHFSNK